jgi:hypothetical protein
MNHILSVFDIFYFFSLKKISHFIIIFFSRNNSLNNIKISNVIYKKLDLLNINKYNNRKLEDLIINYNNN